MEKKLSENIALGEIHKLYSSQLFFSHLDVQFGAQVLFICNVSISAYFLVVHN